jgi:hypothetical protein
MTSEQKNELAAIKNKHKVSNGQTVFMLNRFGQELFRWHQQGDEVLELDAYNGILAKYTLNVDCFKVVRKRETVVTETWVPV